MNRKARKQRVLGSEQKGEGGGNSNCRWAGILIVADQEVVLAAESHEVGMAVLALIVENLGDSERHEGLRVEGD